jgi:hypothetical protein
MWMLDLDRPIDRLSEDRTPLVAARRRASLLAILGCAFILTAVAAVLVGQQAGSQITLVSPRGGAADVAAPPPGDGSRVVAAWCGVPAAGQLRYEVRFDDGTTVQRSEVPTGAVVTIDRDGPTGLPFPLRQLRFSQQSHGTWACSPSYR